MRSFKTIATIAAKQLYKTSFRSNHSVHNYSLRRSDIGDYNINYDNNLGKTTSGSEGDKEGSSHDVWTATHKATNKIVAVKKVNTALVGFGPEQEEIKFTPKKAKELTITEVLTLNLGKLLSPYQFPSANVATDGRRY